MIFSTPYGERYKTPPEVYDKPSRVEFAGYVPAKNRIENLLMAGIRLKEFRAEQFDYRTMNEIDENVYIPTRSKNYDIVDAERDLYGLNERYNARKAEEEAFRASLDTSSENSPNGSE